MKLNDLGGKKLERKNSWQKGTQARLYSDLQGNKERTIASFRSSANGTSMSAYTVPHCGNNNDWRCRPRQRELGQWLGRLVGCLVCRSVGQSVTGALVHSVPDAAR